MPSPASRYALNDKEVAAQVIGGEAILINLSSGVYYSMDGAAGVAWSLLSAGHSVGETIEALRERYDVDTSALDGDLAGLIDSLVAENIIHAADGASAATPDQVADLPDPGQNLPYNRLDLNIYRDLGDLLALDPPMPGVEDIPWKTRLG